MTYATGSPILAADYNAFVTSANNIDEVFSDTHSNATTVATFADYGYGFTSPTDVSVGQAITAAQWATLFNNIRNVGTHQGTTTVPPLPASNPVTGNPIVAYAGMSTLITTLRDPTNRFKLAAGQTAFTSSNSTGTSQPWTNTLTYTFTINLGTWNQARYFFNSGGWVGCSATHVTGGAGSADEEWNLFLSSLGQIQIRAKDTTASGSRTNAISTGGFWGTTGNPLPVNPTAYFEVYRNLYGGGGVYTNSSVSLRVRLSGTPPAAAAGIMEFQLVLTQTDSTAPTQPKVQNTTITMLETHSAGALPFLSGGGGPGPALVTITPGTFTLA